MTKKRTDVPNKPPTPTEINEKNRDFWESINKKIQRIIEKKPHLLEKVVSLQMRLIEAGHLHDARFLSETSIEAALLEEGSLQSIDQSVRAKKPRPKKSATHKFLVIDAMRAARKRGETLNDFIDASGEGSVDGVAITPAGKRGIDRYTVDCDSLEVVKEVSRSTIAEWWVGSGKKSNTD